jgi:tRNA dimethylallyltransferase
MFENGLLEEAEGLKEYKDLMPLNTVGYRELFDYFDGKTDFQTAKELIKRNTRRYARKQITWFGKSVENQWFNPLEEEDKIMEKLSRI